MTCKSQKFLLAALIAGAVAALHTGSANAGGLFGDGGLIRGDVGRFVQHNVNPAVTPVLRGAVVAGGAVAGGVVGGYYGAPHLGAAVGAGIGNGVNNCFAGRC